MKILTHKIARGINPMAQYFNQRFFSLIVDALDSKTGRHICTNFRFKFEIYQEISHEIH
jgi:hypothetical protein